MASVAPARGRAFRQGGQTAQGTAPEGTTTASPRALLPRAVRPRAWQPPRPCRSLPALSARLLPTMPRGRRLAPPPPSPCLQPPPPSPPPRHPPCRPQGCRGPPSRQGSQERRSVTGPPAPDGPAPARTARAGTSRGTEPLLLPEPPLLLLPVEVAGEQGPRTHRRRGRSLCLTLEGGSRASSLLRPLPAQGDAGASP